MQAPVHGERRTRCRGSALVPALFTIVTIAALSMAYVRMSLDKNRETRAAADAKQALYIAEAGLSEAFASLVSGKSGNVASGSLPARFGNGCFWVSAEDLGGERLQLTSTGLCGSGRSALSIVVERVSEAAAALGVFADDRLTVESGVVVDSYDSRLGTYESQREAVAADGVAPSGSRLGSNGDVTLRGVGKHGAPTRIYGDARPGRQHALYRDAGVVITGTTAPNDSRITLSPIAVPKLPYAGDHDSLLPLPLSIQGEERAYGAVRIRRHGRLSIVGPAQVVFADLQVDPGASLSIDGRAGEVRIFVTHRLDLAPGSALATTSRTPSAVSLLVDAAQAGDRDGDGAPEPAVRVGASGSYYGTVYAPHAPLALDAELALYGAVAAKSLELRTGAQVHFDRALVEARGEAAAMPKIVCWRVVDLPVTPLVTEHFDPLTILSLNDLVPPLGADAHVDIGVEPPPLLPTVPLKVPKLGWKSGHGHGHGHDDDDDDDDD